MDSGSEDDFTGESTETMTRDTETASPRTPPQGTVAQNVRRPRNAARLEIMSRIAQEIDRIEQMGIVRGSPEHTQLLLMIDRLRGMLGGRAGAPAEPQLPPPPLMVLEPELPRPRNNVSCVRVSQNAPVGTCPGINDEDEEVDFVTYEDLRDENGYVDGVLNVGPGGCLLRPTYNQLPETVEDGFLMKRHPMTNGGLYCLSDASNFSDDISDVSDNEFTSDDDFEWSSD